jgi:hypothetical protein
MSENIFPATLEQRIDELKKARNILLSEINDKIDLKPSSGWSISEIVHHLSIVEKGITAMLAKVLETKENNPRKPDEELQKEWQHIVSFAANREQPRQAPDRVLPKDAPELSKALNLLEESRTSLYNFIHSTSIDDLASVGMPHPVKELGLISGVGWLSLIAHHELRHVEQIKEIKQEHKK